MRANTVGGSGRAIESERRGRAAALVAALVVWTILGSGIPASAAPHLYTADIGPDTVAAGAVVRFDAVLTNNSGQQQLGSANITPPAGFVLLDAPPPEHKAVVAPTGTATIRANVLELRSLAAAPGSSVSASFTAAVPCSAMSGSWSIAAKQANNFNGPPGNNFTLTTAEGLDVTVSGACALRFAAQPSDAERDATITSERVNPGGEPVQVEVIDGVGARVASSSAVITVELTSDPNPPPGATLSGTTTTPAVSGVATFDDLSINLHGSGYTLTATSPGLGSVTSTPPFTIWDEVVPCAAQETCKQSIRADDRSMTAAIDTVSATSGTLLVSLGADSPLDVDCGDSFNHAPSVLTVDSINLDGTKTVTLTISREYDHQQANNGVSFYEVCFVGEEPFVDRDGAAVAAGDPGLLPSCDVAVPKPPCVLSKTKVQGGAVQVVILLDPADPRMR